MPLHHSLAPSHRMLRKQFVSMSNPDACVYILVDTVIMAHYVDTLTTGEGPEVDEPTRYVESTYNMIWKWVTRPRTPEEIEAIIRIQCSCSKDEQQASSHAQGMSICMQSFSDTPAWQLLGFCLDLWRGTYPQDMVPLNRLRRRSCWPRSIAGILPHGAAETVQGLLQWLNYASMTCDRDYILRSLGNLIHIVQPLVIPHIIVSDTFCGAIWGMGDLAHLLKANHHKRTPQEAIDAVLNALGKCHLNLSLLSTLVLTLSRIERIVFKCRSSEHMLVGNEAVQQVVRYGLNLFQKTEGHKLCHDSRDSFPVVSDKITNVLRSLDLVLSALNQDCPTVNDLNNFYEATDGRADRRQEGSSHGPPIILSSSKQIVKHSVARLGSSERCAAPTCAMTVVDCRLKLCMGCKIVKYCSRLCQRRAWTHSSLGHRNWCNMATVYHTEASTVEGNVQPDASDEMSETDADILLSYVQQLEFMKLTTLNPHTDFSLQPGFNGATTNVKI
jgi:hypothetical protein